MFAHSQEVPFYLSSKFHYNLSTPSVLARMPVNLRPDGTPVGQAHFRPSTICPLPQASTMCAF